MRSDFFFESGNISLIFTERLNGQVEVLKLVSSRLAAKNIVKKLTINRELKTD